MENERFKIIYTQYKTNEHIEILLDTKTNEQYLFFYNGFGSGLTRLKNVGGKNVENKKKS